MRRIRAEKNSKLGSTNEHYLKLSTIVVSVAMRMVVGDVNEAQETAHNKIEQSRYDDFRRILTIAGLKSVIQKAWEATLLMDEFDIESDFKSHYNENRSALKSMCENLGIPTTPQKPNNTTLVELPKRDYSYPHRDEFIPITKQEAEKLIAEKFAEETGFNYQYVKGSDVASPYIDDGKGKIADIFNEARKNAPTILFLDEVDSIIRDRSDHNNVTTAGAVNEFLMQLNNCGKDNILVIGATNKPMDIDEAALRAGRLELKYYIPQPDFETRKEIFKISISKRKYDFGIDYDRLAGLTENYISADISLVIDTAARLAFRRGMDKISMALLEEAISETKPSLSVEQIKRHEEIRDKFMGVENSISANSDCFAIGKATFCAAITNCC